MKPMQMSVKIRTICRRYEKKGASHRSRRHNTKVVNLSGGVIRQSAWRFAPKRAEFGTVGRSPDGRACRDRRPLALTPVMVMASPEREFLNLDEFRRSAGEGMSWQGPPCAAPQGRHQRVRRRPRLARPQPSVEKVYARHPPSPVLRVSGRSAGRAQCQQTRDERWPSTVIRRVTA